MDKSIKFNVILAYSYPEFGIGVNNQLPWSLKGDLIRFKQLTLNSTVIMGRKTWDSLPTSVKPLPNRKNIVITNQLEMRQYNNDNLVFIDWESLMNDLYNYIKTDNAWIIGGSNILKLAQNSLTISRYCFTEVYFNKKKDTSKFDVFIDNTYNTILNSNDYNMYNVSNIKNEIQKDTNADLYYRFYDLIHNDGITSVDVIFKSEEDQYLNIMKTIMERGIERNDRTGTGTLSIFGTQQRYDLSESFPISTTKRIFLRGVFEELMLYLSGRTDNNILMEKNIRIWEGNTSREFLDKRGLTNYKEGDMGETYGFNFRNYGGDYKGCENNYPPGLIGYDQLKNALNLIKNDPTSRRIIINLWNPATLHKAALPSCLMMYQFYVDTIASKLNLQIYIRSSDYFLANNWNTCTGALLVHMICHLKDINLTPGELIVVTSDTHIYKTHLEQVNVNLTRKTRPQPILDFNCDERNDITEFKFEDINLIGYTCASSIKADMAV